jgi:hypothetical protein
MNHRSDDIRRADRTCDRLMIEVRGVAALLTMRGLSNPILRKALLPQQKQTATAPDYFRLAIST